LGHLQGLALMGWLNALAQPPREMRAAKTQGTDLRNPSTWLIDLLGGPDSATGIKVDEQSALTSNAVWACVRILSETIAALPLHVYRNLPDGGKTKAPEYPIYDLLHDQPNPEMTTMEWREAVVGHLALWGNSYSELELDEALRPIAIWPLRPDHMQVWRDPQTRRLQYIYQLWQGGTVYLVPEQVLHIRTLSRDGILGLSPIGMQREAIGLGLALERYGGALYGNGANPGGVLQVPGVLSTAAKENMKSSWETAHRGPGNAGRVAVLEQGVTWQQTGMPPEDAQFILSRQFSLQDVARIYRMPLHKLQDLSRATFSNIEQQSLEFVTDTLLPYLVRSEQAYRRSLIPRLERKRYFVKHAVDALLRGDLASRYEAYAVGRQWGWLSADDIREKEDMNPLPDGAGSDYLVPLNMVPAGEPPPEPPAPTPAATPDQGGVGGVPQTSRMLESFMEDIGRRLVAREDADICRAARKWLGKRRPDEFRRWLGGFIETHRGFIAQQVLPAFRAVDPEFAEELAEEFADRQLRELGHVLADFGSAEELEGRLAIWKEERPAQLAQHEMRRAMRRGLPMPVEPVVETRQAPEVRVENFAPPVHVASSPVTIAEGAVRVETHPGPLNVNDGAFRIENHPAPVTIAEGAVRVENQVAAAGAPDMVIGEGAIRVDVQPPGLTIEEGAVRVDVGAAPASEVTIEKGAVAVDVQPPSLTMEPGAVQVDVQPPPAADVRIEEGAVQVDVDVQPPPPAELRIEEGAVQVDVQPPPPAQMTIEEGAVQVDVAPAQAPQVIFEDGAVRVDAPKPRPKPRLESVRRKLAELEKEKPDE
jgi:HK97 family phage portal protein